MNYSVNSTRLELDPNALRDILPGSPGVYLFSDLSGRVIYVGKAKDLKKRIMSYFRPPDDLPIKTSFMMKKARGLDFLLTATEQEAFILESNLIKKYMPRYNVILRDDKQYPCLRLDIKEPYPRLIITRKIKKDGAIYFGPFASAGAVRSTVKVIDRVFRLRKCRGRGLPKRTRPCLNYQMKLCHGPCAYDVPVSKYREVVEQVRLFLEGRNRELVDNLKNDMACAAGQMDFERAAEIRDQIRAVEKTVERQHVVSPRMEDQDIIGLSREGSYYQVALLFVRRGCMVGSRNYLFRDPTGTASEITEAFLKQYYVGEAFIPREILVSESVEDLSSIADCLSGLSGGKVLIHRPLRGEKVRLVRMAVVNAESLLASRVKSGDQDLIQGVKSVLKLDRAPRVIEGLDISNIQGQMAVGTVVSFVDGLPHKQGYRNYRIRAVDGIDDYSMMAELVERRSAKGDMPDLLLVDGGKGHLSVVKKALEKMGASDLTEVISIAKPDEGRHEKSDKIYLPGRKNPVALRPDHPVLLLMMRIRDEAHRRAIQYHRRLRRKDLIRSDLDLVPGIGPKRKRSLLKHFKDINAVASAEADELSQVPGISRALAENICSFFREKRG